MQLAPGELGVQRSRFPREHTCRLYGTYLLMTYSSRQSGIFFRMGGSAFYPCVCFPVFILCFSADTLDMIICIGTNAESRESMNKKALMSLVLAAAAGMLFAVDIDTSLLDGAKKVRYIEDKSPG